MPAKERRYRIGEEQFRALFAAAPIPAVITRFDEEGTILDLNEPAARLVGAPIEALRGRRAIEFYGSPALRAELRAELLNRGRVDDRELEMRRADGTALWVLISMRLAEFGGTRALFATLKDITDRKRMETRLRENQLRLDLALQVAKASTWELDLVALTHQPGHNYYSMLGYDARSAPRDRAGWLALIHPEDREALLDAERGEPMTRDNAFRESEFRIRAADGTWHWLLSRCRATEFDAQDRATWVVGIDTDITDHKAIEAELQEREQQLRASREHLSRAQRVGGIGSAEVNLRTGEVTWSDELYRLVGIDPSTAAPGVDLLATVIHPDDQALMRDLARRMRQGVEVPPAEFRMVDRQGQLRWLRRQQELVAGEDGTPITAIVTLHDITERKEAEEGLRLAAAVFETTAEGIMVLDAEFRITAVNPSFTAITGHAAASVIGRKPEFLAADGTDGHLQEAIDNAVRLSGRWDHEQWSRRRSGEEYAERLSVTAIHDDEGHVTRYVVVFSDITQRKLDEERIRYQANYDALTGLPNRALFMDRLTQAIIAAERSHQKVAVMFIDLDGFKLVNDTLGHDVGDDLLKEAARRLLASVRAGDTVARLGGDEFTVIMPNLADFHSVPVVAQRIIESVELPFRLKTHEVFVSASIGVTAYPDDAMDVNSLLRNADAAMYQAKEQGKANFQFFTAALNAQVSERLVIKNGLSKALERNEFMLYYQPKIELASGKLTGVEALLRWRSPDLGMVSPAKFIPVTEETGLISAVGEWALVTACEQHRKWRDAGFPHMRVAVNLSVRQLRQHNLVRSVAGILDRAGVDPSCLELEITESMIMKDTENAVAVLRSLSDMGIRLAMDDFGTGYSSLSYLKRFPLHTIKIDRSFIHDIAVDPDDLEIIRTIITMGHSLRRRIIAEGVETEEQLSLLRKLHCDEIQGYLLSPPVPAAEIDRMLGANGAAIPGRDGGLGGRMADAGIGPVWRQ